MACTAGAETNEMPAPDHQCMYTYITHCMPQAHNISYNSNNSNINGKSYNKTTIRRTLAIWLLM